MTTYNKNIVTDYSCPTNGTSDCSTAWENFNLFLDGLVAGDSVVLTVPAHTYNFAPANYIELCRGILGGITLVINATGAVFTGTYSICNQVAFRDSNQYSSRVATADSGATSVTLLTLSEHSRFSVNQWVCVAGVDLQGYGSPINPAFFEYRKITAKDTGTGVISFSVPLVNRYLSTWPVFNSGSSSAVPNALDCGGPATIYAMPVSWDIDVTFNGMTSSGNSGQTYAKARKVVFNGGGCTNTTGIVPTANQFITFNDFNQSTCSIEVDKVVENLTYSGTSSVNQIIIQSMSSATNLNVTGTVVVGTWNGTPTNLNINGGTSTLMRLGPTGYGRSETVTINNHVVSTIDVNPVNIPNVFSSGYTMANGIVTGTGPLTWAIPGTWCYFAGSQQNENNGFRVSTLAGTPTSSTGTTSRGGFPNVPLQGGTALALLVHPCPIWNGSGNTGCADIVDLSQMGAQGKPLYSYSKRTWTGNDLIPAGSGPVLWGRIIRIDVRVNTAYAGAGTLTMNLFGQFMAAALAADNTVSSWSPSVNLKIAGTRTYTSISGWTNIQSGDSLSDPGNIWFSGRQGPYASADATGKTLSVEIEVTTDQGLIVPLARGFNRWRSL